jgi:hypothetical protein
VHMKLRHTESEGLTGCENAEFENDIFIVSDGTHFDLAKLVCLIAENPDCGADWDEYEFRCLSKSFSPKFFAGPFAPHQVKFFVE